MSKMLNGTVTHGLRLSATIDRRGRAVIGNRAGKSKPLGEPLALTISGAPARLELRLLHTLELDEAGRFLTTSKSSYKLAAAGSGDPIVTYDYTREPPNEYPEAHFHVHGQVDAVQRMLERSDRVGDKPDDLHFPVGGRRFRPCLEDLIEFCILERLADARPDWQPALEESRARFHEQQLRAAVRRNPGLAAGVLRLDGWEVAAPDAQR